MIAARVGVDPRAAPENPWSNRPVFCGDRDERPASRMRRGEGHAHRSINLPDFLASQCALADVRNLKPAIHRTKSNSIAARKHLLDDLFVVHKSAAGGSQIEEFVDPVSRIGHSSVFAGNVHVIDIEIIVRAATDGDAAFGWYSGVLSTFDQNQSANPLWSRKGGPAGSGRARRIGGRSRIALGDYRAEQRMDRRVPREV
ncbi:MAG: hypothetical protein ACI8UO_003356 [Verrucomicrobiales bacterium]|jgi:hypothetical protein